MLILPGWLCLPQVQVDEGHAGSLLAALSSLRAGSPTSCDLQLTGSDGAGCAVHRCVALALAPGLADKLAGGPFPPPTVSSSLPFAKGCQHQDRVASPPHMVSVSIPDWAHHFRPCVSACAQP